MSTNNIETEIKAIRVNLSEFKEGRIGIKLSDFRPDLVDILRYIPSRQYSDHNKTNYFDQKFLEEISRKVETLENVEFEIEDSIFNRIIDYRNLPAYSFSIDNRNNIRVDMSWKGERLYVYDIETWNYHINGNYYTFQKSEAYKLPSILEKYFRKHKINSDQWDGSYDISISQDLIDYINTVTQKRDSLKAFATLEDAPWIESPFTGINPKTQKKYELTKDQKIAIAFDEATNGRSIFAYDMGKGKTAIAIALAERNNHRILFICKANLKTNIKREIFKFTGKEAIVFSGIEPDNMSVKYLFENKQQYNILNYDVVGRSIEQKDIYGNVTTELMKWVEIMNLSGFDRIYYDEAHYMKNMESKRSKGGRALKAPKFDLFTGTPIVNRPQEIYPLLNIVDPDTFHNYNAFISNYSDGKNGVKNVEALRELLSQYMLVRKNVGLDINRIPITFEMSSLNRARYNKVLEGIYINLRSGKHLNVPSVLAELIRLKQIVADETVEYTVDHCEEVLDQTEKKVLIFSQFKDCHAQISKKLGKKCSVINGDVTDDLRYELIDKFQDPNSDIKVIVTNILEGITLTEAHTCIFNDLWWTPKDHLQAEGRCFGRINDYHTGNSYYMICENTIIQMIQTILAEKLDTIEKVVDGKESESNNEMSVVSTIINQLKRGV